MERSGKWAQHWTFLCQFSHSSKRSKARLCPKTAKEGHADCRRFELWDGLNLSHHPHISWSEQFPECQDNANWFYESHSSHHHVSSFAFRVVFFPFSIRSAYWEKWLLFWFRKQSLPIKSYPKNIESQTLKQTETTPLQNLPPTSITNEQKQPSTTSQNFIVNEPTELKFKVFQ